MPAERRQGCCWSCCGRRGGGGGGGGGRRRRGRGRRRPLRASLAHPTTSYRTNDLGSHAAKLCGDCVVSNRALGPGGEGHADRGEKSSGRLAATATPSTVTALSTTPGASTIPTPALCPATTATLRPTTLKSAPCLLPATGQRALGASHAIVRNAELDVAVVVSDVIESVSRVDGDDRARVPQLPAEIPGHDLGADVEPPASLIDSLAALAYFAALALRCRGRGRGKGRGRGDVCRSCSGAMAAHRRAVPLTLAPPSPAGLAHEPDRVRTFRQGIVAVELEHVGQRSLRLRDQGVELRGYLCWFLKLLLLEQRRFVVQVSPSPQLKVDVLLFIPSRRPAVGGAEEEIGSVARAVGRHLQNVVATEGRRVWTERRGTSLPPWVWDCVERGFVDSSTRWRSERRSRGCEMEWEEGVKGEHRV